MAVEPEEPQAAVDIGQQEPSNPAADAADALSLLLEQQERQRRSRGGRRRRALHIEAIELLPRSDGVRPTASGACLRRAIDGGALEFDGRRLALAGGAPVLRALSAAAYAAVAEVALVGVPFASILACSGAGSGTGFGALAALAALRHLRRLELRDNGVATLPCLDALAPLSRVRALVIEGSPVSGAALLRPYVAYRLPHVRELNGAPLGRAEAAAGRALLGGFDVELAAALVGPAQRAALAAAGLPAPPPLALAGAGEGQWPVAAAAAPPPGRRDGEAVESEERGSGADDSSSGEDGGGDGGECALLPPPPPPRWLLALRAQLAGGAALATPFADGSPAAARGAAFARAVLGGVEAARARADALAEGWEPLLAERCAEEGWRGIHTLPAAPA